MGDILVVGVDPASTRLAFAAKHPLLPTFATAKYTLGKRSSPQAVAEAMDASLAYLESIATMATSKTAKVGFIEAPTTGYGGKANVQSSFKQCFVSGVVQACMIKAGYDVHLVPVSTWKRVVVGKGNATKDDVARTVAGRWPKVARTIDGDADLADAVCVWSYGDTITRRGLVVASEGVV